MFRLSNGNVDAIEGIISIYDYLNCLFFVLHEALTTAITNVMVITFQHD